jgi:hypothetical protein
MAAAVGHTVEAATGFVEWAVTALFDGLIGLAAGLALIPLVDRAILPLARVVGLADKKGAAGSHA